MAPEKSPSTSKEKILQIKRTTLKIVEALIEEDVSKEWFLKNCLKLCQTDYDDVVLERSISLLCGYSLCSKPIKNVKQQYKISRSENKVYDITERKKFCSNECYKASNYLKAQLHAQPQWLRKPDKSPLELKLLSDSENKGSAGEELLFKGSLSKTEVEQSFNHVTEPVATMHLTNMLKEDLKDCAEHLAGLNIKENVYKNKYVFGGLTAKETADNSDEETSSDSPSLNSDDEDKPAFPEYGNIDAYSNKHMPAVFGKRKAAVLIPSLHAPQEPTQNPTKLPIDLIVNIFQDWYTEGTLKYLFGERQLYSIKADHLFKSLVNSTDSEENLSSLKEEYVNLCLKIDKLPDEEEEDINKAFETDVCDPEPVKKSEAKHNKLENLASEIDSKLESTKPVVKRKVKRKPRGKRSVSFASDTKPAKPVNLPRESESTLPEPTLPLIDSLSQSTRRKQILLGNLKNTFVKILPVIDLRYNVIQKEVADLVDTFSLTPSNTVLKPKQLKCVAVVIFRILTKTKLNELHLDDEFTKLCDNALTSLNISQDEVERLSLDLVSPNQVFKL